MIRFKLALIVLGGIIGYWGFQEFSVSSGASDKPAAVELAQLEANPSVKNNHLKIGSHFALYPLCVYQYETVGYTNNPGKHTKVNYAYYPMISQENAFFTELESRIQKYGSFDKIPNKDFPQIKTFTVLGKTNRFRKIGDIPEEMVEEKSVQGLVINRIKSLSGEERDLIQSNFPNVDLDKVLILEDGRKPSSIAKSAGIMGLGALLVLGGIGMFFMPSKK